MTHSFPTRRSSDLRNREVEIVPSFQSIIFGIVDARKALRLTVIIAAEGQFPIATVDEGGILRAQIEGQPGRVGQFIAAKVSKKAAPAIRRAADLAAPRIGIRRSEERRVGEECVSPCRCRVSPYP